MTTCIWCTRQTGLCMHEKPTDEELGERFREWMLRTHPDWTPDDDPFYQEAMSGDEAQ